MDGGNVMFKSAPRLATFLFIFSLIIAFSNPADADDGIIFERTFTIGEWHLHASRHTFSANDFGQGILTIGKSNPQEEIQHGFLVLNGAFVFLRDFLAGDELVFEKDIALKATNGLIVFLMGDPGASLSMQISGIKAPVTPPQINAFTAEPASMKRGESATLSWQTLYAESCVIEPGIGAVDPSGSVSVTPTDSTVYKLTAEGAGDPATAAATVTIENSAPVAQAGPDRDVFVDDTVMLDGSGSVDVDQDSLNFSWNFVSIPQGSTAALSESSIVNPTFIPDVDGNYEIRLIVNDGSGNSDSDTVIISARPRMVAVPIVVEKPRADAEASILAARLVVGAISFEHSETVAHDHVISQSPVAGISVVENSAVDLIVSLGSENQPPTVNFSSSPSSISKGGSATLSWTSLRADSAHIDKGIGKVSVEETIDVFPEHTTIYTITVTGPAGSANARVMVQVTGKPAPQPEGSYGERYEDLVPPDATVDQYDPKRFSLITGLVQDIDQLPLPGVAITIHSHAQYGSVFTDDRGRFSIPVEGGGTLTVIYQKQGLIPVQRKVYVPWNDNAIAEAIVMIAEDPAVTTLTFDDDPNTVITHKSADITDESGTRAVTMVFTGDNKAYLVDEEGNDVQELTTITARATEYPTPESMPAKLPPTSAFTYCAELSVDGAQRVRFDRPVMIYVDNFLNFPVGSIVPVGYYDRDKGVWVPSENGVVVKLLDLDGDGIVDALDADGNDQPDDLDEDGFFIDEVKGLNDEQRYLPETTYWRAAIKHFTPCDLNWPIGAPPGAISPNPAGITVVDQQDSGKLGTGEKSPNDIQCIASFVEQRSRVFHEDIPIPGTNMRLHYTSSRTSGYKPGVITIPASGDTVPESLQKIIVQVNVAGKTFELELPPAPNQVAEFEWDGFDHMGRGTSGTVVAYVKIGFVYKGVYYVPGRFGPAFGQPGQYPFTIPSRQEVTLWQYGSVPIARSAGVLAEGWTLSEHHQLSPLNPGILFKGDGTTSKNNVRVIDKIAGNGIAGFSGDGGPATEARINYVTAIETDAAGNLYICDYINGRIRKVDSDGTISTASYEGDPHDVTVDSAGNLYTARHLNSEVRKRSTDGAWIRIAGTGRAGYSGDGGPAVNAQINYPKAVEIDASGNLYIADTYNHRIRKIDTAGIITTVAGNGTRGHSGDGGSAIQAQITYPSDIVIDAAGNLFIAEGAYIRKVDNSGIITTMAGDGGWTNLDDGVPATQASLDEISGLAVDAWGNLYLTEIWNNHRVRKIDTLGIITTIAGGVRGGYSGDGGPAADALLDRPTDVAVDAAGNIYISDWNNYRIRKVSTPSARLTATMSESDFAFTEENGTGFIMSSAGLHKKTIDLNSGVSLYEFIYDEESNLLYIIDQFENTISIERNASGMPIAIISPDGIRTGLSIDANNHLNRVTYADGSAYEIEYTTDGLMKAEIEPAGNRFEHKFDGQGRLKDVLDEEGGRWTYSRASDEKGGIMTEVLSAEGNITAFFDHTDSTGKYTSQITDPTGTVTQFVQSGDELTVNKSLPCGIDLEYIYDLDPEYKYRYLKELTERTPAGLERVTTTDKSYTDTDANDIPDLISETFTVNGKVTHLQKNTLLAQEAITSPEGRTTTSHYDPATLLVESVSVPGLHPTTYGYDSRGRLTSITTNTRQSAFTYNVEGFLGSVTDPEGHKISYEYDPVGRMTGINRPDGNFIDFSYDANGNMTVLLNPAGTEHKFGYNRVNRNSSYMTPLSGTYTYVYDKDRRLIQTIFPSGTQISNIYENGRLVQTQTPDGNIDYSYLCGTKIGSITKGAESINYGYDGKLITFETLSGILSQSLSYTYNDDFNVSTFSYAGSTVNYAYDNDGLLTGSGAYSISRNPENGLPEQISGGALNLIRAFNGYGEVDGQDVNVGSRAVSSWDLTRDNNGRIIQKTEIVGGITANYVYTYDLMGRLLTVIKDDALVEEYHYDANGTRNYELNALRGISDRNFKYSEEDHLLIAGDMLYEYDTDGFLTNKTNLTNATDKTYYAYSSSGELLSVNLPDGRIIEYIHDPLGRRIAKKIGGVIVEKYLWQGMTRLLAVYDGADNLLMRFEYADDRMPIAVATEGVIYYLGYDPVGSLRVVADSAGNVVKRINYDSFGSIISDTNEAFKIPIGFAGGLHDRDTGLVRFGFRDYDPNVGRWTAKDPIFFVSGDTDLYGYVLNDPVNWIDPLGFLNIDPGLDSSLGPKAFYIAGASLLTTGALVTKMGAGIMAGGGPIGWIGGGIVTIVGATIWGFGAWTVYQGVQVHMDIGKEKDLPVPDSFWGTGTTCLDY
jgi:RHS repeat-associated protein